MKRIPSLDGLRALSIALVVVGHLAGTRHFLSAASIGRFGDLGNFGVRVFFVISGFLITRLLLVELAATQRISLRMFYIRRFLRLFPALYALLAVVALLAQAGTVDVDRRDFVHAVSYTMNYYVSPHFTLRHLWSLSVEEQFYIAWPLTLSLLGIVRAKWVLGGVMLIAPMARLARFYVFPGAPEELVSTAFETVSDALATGCLAAMLLPSAMALSWVRRVIASPIVPAMLVTAFVVNTQSDHVRLFWLVGIPFMNLTIALVLARYVHFPQLPAARLLNTKALVAVGVGSYSLYLWQQVFLIQGRPPTSVLQQFPANVIMAAACATVSYLYIEKPFLRMKRYFEPARTPRSERVDTAVTLAPVLEGGVPREA
jgi:peptidoglycan/LPS O-acetylase OafA/YrhL